MERFSIYSTKFCKMNNYYQKKLALAENPKTRWCCAALARLRFVIFGYASFFCIYCDFANFLRSGRWLRFARRSHYSLFFLVYRVFSETIVILQTFCVRVENWACFVSQNLPFGYFFCYASFFCI